jgi:hypothetical protein
MIQSFPDKTLNRTKELGKYLDREVLRDKKFVCRHDRECRASCGDLNFIEGQLHHVGQHYDLEIDGESTRIVIVGQEYGHEPPRVSLEDRSEMIRDSANRGFRGRNPHMKGTTTLLRLLLRRTAGEDASGEQLFPDCSTHIFEGFALVNYLLCSAVEGRRDLSDHYGALRGRSSKRMQKNCAAHFLKTIDILDPTIIVVQGFGVRNWLERSFSLQRRTNPIEQVSLGNTSRTLMTFMHPSAPRVGWWGNSIKSKYLHETVVPTVQAYLDQNRGRQ